MPSSCNVDVLTDMLGRSGARGAAFARSTVRGDGGVRFPAGPALAVHAIVDGEVHAWAHDPDASIRLAPGDIVLVREGVEHQLGRRAGAPCVALRDLLRTGSHRGAARRLIVGGPDDGPASEFFCGAYVFEGDLFRPLL